jgi:hypothetical protein
MGREFIGECPGWGDDPDADDLEAELAIKYIKQECGKPPRGVDVQATLEDHELGNYPVISVVWDDFVTGYPSEYIGKCIEALERLDLPDEIYQRGQRFLDTYERIQKLFDKD